MGVYQWTPELQLMRDKVKYLRLSLSRLQGCHIGARVVLNLSKKVKMNVVSWNQDRIKKELYNTTKAFEKEKKHHVQHRKSYLDDLATALAMKKKLTKSVVVKQITQLEEQRAIFRRLKIVNHKISNLSTSHITINNNGTKEEITDPQEMDQAFCNENRKKYHQTENTCPFMVEPLRSHFGDFGEGTETTKVLSGTYDPPPSVSQDVKDFLQACKIPEGTTTNLPRTAEHFSQSWKRMREDTGTGSIHFGYFKAATEHKTNILLHYALAEIPFRSGYTPERWKQATNVMILKKEGITDIDRLRTIVLFEADYNHNNKFLGRQMMSHGIKHQLLTPEQYSIPG